MMTVGLEVLFKLLPIRLCRHSAEYEEYQISWTTLASLPTTTDYLNVNLHDMLDVISGQNNRRLSECELARYVKRYIRAKIGSVGYWDHRNEIALCRL